MHKQKSRQRHFRATIVWSVAGIALVQIMLGSAIDVALPKVRDPEYVHREELLRQRLDENDGKPVVMVVGSSRISNGFDAATAASTLNDKAVVFNFGIPTSGPFLESVVLERLFKSGLKPDLLLIEVMPLHYNGARTPQDLMSLDGARLVAHEVAEVPTSFAALTGPLWRWVRGRALPSCRHQAELRGLVPVIGHDGDIPRDLKSLDRFGWQACSVAPERIPALKQLAHAQYDKSFRDFQLAPRQVRLLEEILARCQREGIKTALLLAPEGSEFRRLYSSAMTAAIDKLLGDMRERFGVTVVDARAWMNDDAFFDQHHMLLGPARDFSERLAREAIRPLLSQ